jgi:hypothetical protein
MARAERELPASLRLGARWREPETRHVYPFAFESYRQMREREERWPPRHERLGYQVEHRQWEQWTSRGGLEDVFEVRPEAPPRIQRLIGGVLRSIGSGTPADRAISHASRQLRVTPSRVRAWIAAHIRYQRPLVDRPSA